MSRIIIGPNWIGDAVMALPVLRAIARAHPEELLTVIARRGPAAVFQSEGSAGRVRISSSMPADVAWLLRGGFREAWLLPNSFRSALLPFLAGIPERIGYSTDGRRPLLTHALPPPLRIGHQARDYDSLLESRGIPPDLEPPRLPVGQEAARRAGEALARAGLDRPEGLVLLAPGAAFGPTKRWPAERYGQLARRLGERGLACGIAIGPREGGLAGRVAAAAGVPLPILGEDLDPGELAALLARARVVVANDSGPMHLAAAVGTPVVAFFGPTDPGRTSPTGAPARILDRYVFCSPCFLKKCPYGHECMREITVEMAAGAVEGLLEGPSSVKRKA
jgi:heptosyltransferase-2